MNRDRTESGHALVEALTLGVLLMIPVIWMLTVFADLHAAALATTSAAREAGFEAARSTDAASADTGMTQIVGGALRDHGLDLDDATVSWTAPRGWQRGDDVEITVTYEVPVLQLPILGAMTDPAIPVSATHVATIDPYRSRP